MSNIYNHFVAEYFFNASVGQYVRKTNSKIPTKELIEIHDDLLSKHSKDNFTFNIWSDKAKEKFVKDMNSIFLEKGYDLNINKSFYDFVSNRFASNIATRDYVNKQISNFESLEEAKKKGFYVRDNRRNNFVAVSFFDKAFRNRETFSSNVSKIYDPNGNFLGYVDIADIESYCDLLSNYNNSYEYDPKNRLSDFRNLNINMGSLNEKASKNDYAVRDKFTLSSLNIKNLKGDDLGPLLSEKDATGMMLDRYFTHKDSKKLEAYFSKLTISPTQKDYVMIDEVLSKLQDEGELFELDVKSDQVGLDVSGVNITMHSASSRPFSIRSGGNHYSLSAKKDGKYMGYTPKSNEIYDLFKFAKGDIVEKNGAIIGSNPDDIKFKNYNKYIKQRQRDTVEIKYNSLDNADLMISTYTFANDHVARLDYEDLDVDFCKDSLKNKLDSVKDEFYEVLDLDNLYDKVSKLEEGDKYEPNSRDKEIQKLEKLYANYIRGDVEELYKPCYAYSDFLEMQTSGEYKKLSQEEKTTLIDSLEKYDDEDKLRNIKHHLFDYIEHNIGNFEPDERGKRFDPRYFYKFSSVELDNGDYLLEYSKRLGFEPSDFKSSSSLNNAFYDKLVVFDEDSAERLMDKDDEFLNLIADDIVKTSKSRSHIVNKEDIYLDKNGIIKFEAINKIDPNKTDYLKKDEKVTMTIGQVFSREKEGYIKTKFNSDRNYSFIPHYEANITKADGRTVEERTVLRGYEQIMRDEIKRQVSTNLTLNRDKTLRANTSLNKVYAHMLDTRYDLDYFSDLDANYEDDFSKHQIELKKAILETECRKVKYPNYIKANATLFADLAAKEGNISKTNDLVDGRNMSLLTEESDGYFDRMVTGNATNQGITRYLVEGAKVSPDGKIVPSDDLEDRTPIMKLDICKSMEFDPFDRQQMSISNLMRASAITEPTNVANLTFGGWTQDDSIVISKRFAEKYQINSHGNVRPLIIGDKICDLHGNKGCISLVVDPDMDMEEAREKGIGKCVEWFKANPELDVVMAPFPPVSRFNGGTTREIMNREVKDLYDPSGSIHTGAIGQVNFIVTNLSVDSKTKIYDEESIIEGKGRKASSQLAWSIQARGGDSIMDEIYSNNMAIVDFRETLISLGMDISEKGEILNKYTPHNGEKRKIIKVDSYFDMSKPMESSVDNFENDKEQFLKDLDKSGFLEIPFDLRFPNGTSLPKSENGYLLPIIPKHLRSSVEKFDGIIRSDHDKFYEKIYDLSLEKKSLNSYLENNPDIKDQMKFEHLSSIERMDANASRAFKVLNDKTIDMKLNNKDNIIKETIMSRRLPRSATAVWTGDPTLDINEIAISDEIAKNLKAKDGDFILAFRDPQIRKEGAYGLRVKIKDDITGCAISPCLAAPFYGDFDGDSVGLWNPERESSKRELRTKFNPMYNLLDESEYKDGKSALYVNGGLDIKIARYFNEELDEKWKNLTEMANKNMTYKRYYNGLNERRKIEIEDKFKDFYGVHPSLLKGETKEETNLNFNKVYAKKDKEIFFKLNTLVHKAYSNEFGGACSRYDSLAEHMKKCYQDCIETGAKGSMGKLDNYAKYLGVTYEKDEDGNLMPETVIDYGQSLATRKDREGTQYALTVKSFGTGLAGTVSQKGVSMFRNTELDSVLMLTSSVTQSLLQSKHDDVEAMRKIKVVSSIIPKVWAGKAYDIVEAENGEVEFVETEASKNNKLTTREWRDHYEALAINKNGLNLGVNPIHLNAIAKSIDNGGYISGINEPLGPDNSRCSTMDVLTYINNSNTYEQLNNMVGRSIYEGAKNLQFAPRIVRQNMEATSKEDMIGFYDKSICEPKIENDISFDVDVTSDIENSKESVIEALKTISNETTVEKPLTAKLNQEKSIPDINVTREVEEESKIEKNNTIDAKSLLNDIELEI